MPSSNIIQWGATSLRRVRVAGRLAIQQVAHLGKASNSIPWFPYGFDANVPTKVLSVLLGVLGLDSRTHLPGTPPDQVPDLAVGEVVVFHPKTGSKVHFLDDGSISIEAGGASIVISAAGAIDLTPKTGQKVTVNGDLDVTGSLDVTAGVTIGTTLAVTGASTLSATVTSGGTDISNTHTHSAGSYLDSSAGAVTGISGAPV